MSVNSTKFNEIKNQLGQKGVTLVAVSKTKPPEDVLALYKMGQLDFGENYVQELVEKQQVLPANIRWHFIGHLQTNKVKLIAPFVQMVQGVDSLKLLKEINKQAEKNDRIIDCLLQVHIAMEETKFGLDEGALNDIMIHPEFLKLSHIRVIGLMGMSTLTENAIQIRNEFKVLKQIFDKYTSFKTLSMGMSGDYEVAIEEGSTMVRIGSLLFGERNKA